MNGADHSPAQQLVQMLITVGLTLVMGIEREERSATEKTYAMAGVRTFPLVGLLGYAVSVLSPDSALPVALGLLALSALLVVSYTHKLKSGDHGATTEVAVAAAYLIGALAARGLLAVAAGLTVAGVLLLQAKVPLKRFAVELPPHEVRTFAQFLLLAAVILPVLPNQPYGPFRLNPYKTWLIVVAVSGLSYGTYLAQRLVRGRQSVLLTALLGGAYSSTVTTVVLAKHGKGAAAPRLYAGAMLIASGVMYLRLAILLAIFNADLGLTLGAQLVLLAAVGCGAGYLVAIKRPPGSGARMDAPQAVERHPLELTTAMAFAALFLGISVLTQVAAQRLGAAGVYGLAALTGAVDIDPFILGLTQTAGGATPLAVAAVAVIVAAASNNLIKGLYAIAFGDRRTGIVALALLIALALISLLALPTITH